MLPAYPLDDDPDFRFIGAFPPDFIAGQIYAGLRQASPALLPVFACGRMADFCRFGFPETVSHLSMPHPFVAVFRKKSR